MLTQLLSLVLLVGLTATTLLLCFDKWGWLAAWEVRRPAWLMKPCLLCAGYWLSVGQLVVVAGVAVVGQGLPGWCLLLALPLGLPAAAISRVGYGLAVGR